MNNDSFFPTDKGPSGPTIAGESASGQAKEKQPNIALPKGGGAIQSIGEKFQVNPVTGTGSLNIPFAMSPGRSGFTPQLALNYDSGAGNSPFGLGWGIGLPSISRKTQKGLPRYVDEAESDTFLLSGAEDLVPLLGDPLPKTMGDYAIKRYRPRIEGLFARIEKWTHKNGSTFWKSITRANIVTIYGQSDTARIFHPEDNGKPDKRIFQWLIERSFDDKGNIIFYEYKAEDLDLASDKLSECNRPLSAQRYLKRVCYGNTRPYVSGGINTEHQEPDWTAWNDANTWLFELVLDYGEHGGPDSEIPSYDPQQSWSCRPDIFSNFRSGFDIRTYRLCRRILMFHRFKELWMEHEETVDSTLAHRPVLVRSTDLYYEEDPLATKLTAVTHTSYRKAAGSGESYEKALMPPVEFSYTQSAPDFTVRTIEPQALDNLPQGLDGSRYHWQDLYGEGIGGILVRDPEAWYYKPNLGHGHFGPMTVIAEQPALAGQPPESQQLVDLGGDGQQNLVVRSSSLSGYYEMDDDGHWKNFRAFASDPKINWQDPNLRLIDLTGDGHADLLITEDDCFVWRLSLAEDGFEAAQRVAKAVDETFGPRIVFSDRTQSIHLADMTGDGLIDIVRIRNGAICYWANQGYGRFSAQIQMDDAPVFDHPDQFDPRRLRLTDIDGSGTTDIFYLADEKIRYWHNESGNGWSEPQLIPNFPFLDNLAAVDVIDLLGRGTACLVRSTPLPALSNSPIQYIDLMPEKPHLLVGIDNNLGAVTSLQYRASTHFYLQDKKNGTPWITRIPFPVHVLVRSETYDAISDNRFVTRYAYHHGYFDGVEREFRGFGLVEQWDTEDYAGLYTEEDFTPPGTNWSEETDMPPVYTKTWFHTGFYLKRDRISRLYEQEYYREKDEEGNLTGRDWLLEDTILPAGLTLEEEREACRALKGRLLHQEIYARDGSEKQEYPYLVTENTYTLQCLQHEEENQYAVFLATPRESLSYHYERNPDDPRIAHSANLQVDEYGHVTHAVAIVYPRRAAASHPVEQQQLYATLAEQLFVHRAVENNWYRHSVPVESRSYEVHGLKNHYNGTDKLAFSFLREQLFAANRREDKQEIDLNRVSDYSADLDSIETTGLRLLNRKRQLFYNNQLDACLPFGELESLALPYRSYALAFTAGVLDQDVGEGPVRNKITPERLQQGGYRTSDELFDEPEEGWWIPSSRSVFETEPARAAAMFYLPRAFRDALGMESRLEYDKDPGTNEENDYYLLLQKMIDPLGNVTSARHNYRLLQPWEMTDPNQNRLAVAFDVHGMVIATAAMGEAGAEEGDELQEFQGLTGNATEGYLSNILSDPRAYLGQAGAWFYYDLFAWKRDGRPPCALGLSREIHWHDEGGPESLIQRAITYSDGFGRQILSKVQAEPGLAPERDIDGVLLYTPDGKIRCRDTADPDYAYDRWVGNGRTVFNNKGKPVKQYEPFFDSGFGYTTEDDLLEFGVTPIFRYDPLGRSIRTDFPDGTHAKVEFTPWEQISFDPIDTLSEDNDWYQRLKNSEVTQDMLQRFGDRPLAEQQQIAEKIVADQHKAAAQALALAGTPVTQHLDTLGRPFAGIAWNKFFYSNDESGEQFVPTHTVLNIEGKPLAIYDGRGCEDISREEAVNYRGNGVMTYRYAMNGLQLYQNSMDAGERWALVNVLGNPIHSWDARGRHTYLHYDPLQRPTHVYVEYEPGKTLLTERLYYGEASPDALENNRCGQLWLHFDGAGVIRNELFDFKGNPLRGSRLLSKVDYAALRTTEETAPSWQEIIPDWSVVLAETPAAEALGLLSHRFFSQRRGDAAFDFRHASRAENRSDRQKIGIPGALASVADQLESETFTTISSFDALNRMTGTIAPDGAEATGPSRYRFGYNEAGFLEKIEVFLQGEASPTAFVTNIAYNARGQRTRIRYGNGAVTRYDYDPYTFRLERLRTTRALGESNTLQDYLYTYDPAGNITAIQDHVQPTVYYAGSAVEAHGRYLYDSLYRLIEATGREGVLSAADQAPGPEDLPLHQNIPASDVALRNYRQRYHYDLAGNILRMRHLLPAAASAARWTRTYDYAPDSNRLLATTQQDETTPYTYDAHGSMTTLPHLSALTWDYKDQLVHTNRHGDGEAFYSYDSGRQRVRKVYFTGNLRKERLYLGIFELYREYGAEGALPKEELQTLHVMDDSQRICMVETTTIKTGELTTTNGRRHFRYQLTNHLGTATVELDETAQIITYEEYHPYGASAFRARKSGVEASPKRYRYTGMERDEETGMGYHGARYYLVWLGRWGSGDPMGLVDGSNLYFFVRSNPIRLLDPTGRQGDEFDEYTEWIIHESIGQSEEETGISQMPPRQEESATVTGVHTHVHGSRLGNTLSCSREFGCREQEPEMEPMTPVDEPEADAQLAERMLPIVATWEGIRTDSYVCSAQKLSIGIGFNIQAAGHSKFMREVLGLSTEQIQEIKKGKSALSDTQVRLLYLETARTFIAEARDIVGEEAWRMMPEKAQIIMTEVLYGYGPAGVKKHLQNFVEALQVQDWKKAGAILSRQKGEKYKHYGPVLQTLADPNASLQIDIAVMSRPGALVVQYPNNKTHVSSVQKRIHKWLERGYLNEEDALLLLKSIPREIEK